MESSEVLVASDADALTCSDVDGVSGLVAHLASRGLSARQTERLRADWTARFRADPQGARGALTEVQASLAALQALGGQPATTARADLVWSALAGDTALGGDSTATVSILRAAVAPWATDTDTHLILSEMDVEGWLKYASLCREVQGGTPLTLSVADRVILYRIVGDAFRGRTREEQLAVLSIGPIWPTLRDRWPGVTYEIQQAWAEAAPLPGPMTATSLAYAEAVLEADLARHAEALHRAMGPLPVGVAE